MVVEYSFWKQVKVCILQQDSWSEAGKVSSDLSSNSSSSIFHAIAPPCEWHLDKDLLPAPAKAWFIFQRIKWHFYEWY